MEAFISLTAAKYSFCQKSRLEPRALTDVLFLTQYDRQLDNMMLWRPIYPFMNGRAAFIHGRYQGAKKDTCWVKILWQSNNYSTYPASLSAISCNIPKWLPILGSRFERDGKDCKTVKEIAKLTSLSLLYFCSVQVLIQPGFQHTII